MSLNRQTPDVLIRKNQSLQKKLLETTNHLLKQQNSLQESLKQKRSTISQLQYKLEKRDKENHSLTAENNRLLEMHHLLESELYTWKEKYRNMEKQLKDLNQQTKAKPERDADTITSQTAEENASSAIDSATPAHEEQEQPNSHHTTVNRNTQDSTFPIAETELSSSDQEMHSVGDFFSDTTIRHILSSAYEDEARLSEMLYQDSKQPFLKQTNSRKSKEIQCNLLTSSTNLGHNGKRSTSSKMDFPPHRPEFLPPRSRTALGSSSKATTFHLSRSRSIPPLKSKSSGGRQHERRIDIASLEQSYQEKGRRLQKNSSVPVWGP